MSAPLISLLTDFGTKDAYLGQVKARLLSICPDARLVDITHEIAAQDIVGGALILSQAAPYFPEGTIHLAVVDPGVGTNRPMVAVEVDTQASSDEAPRRQRFVLPDNGLIGRLTERFGFVGATRLTNSKFWASPIAPTFHGRDILGPVAAHWALGVDRNHFGEPHHQLVPCPWTEPTVSFGSLQGEIIAIDHFGNAITNLPRNALRELNAENVTLSIGLRDFRIPVVATYGQRAAGEAILLVGSHDLLELAIVGGSAAAQFGLRRGELVRLASPINELS